MYEYEKPRAFREAVDGKVFVNAREISDWRTRSPSLDKRKILERRIADRKAKKGRE
jgi:hypothetical protein